MATDRELRAKVTRGGAATAPAGGVSAVTGEARRGEGLRVRLSRIPGATARGVLASPLYIPCWVGDFSPVEEFGHDDYLTPDGEFSAPSPGDKGARRLRTLDGETLTIDFAADWLPGGWTDPHKVRVALQDLGRSRSPCEMLASVRLDRREELRMYATLRSLTRTLRPGEADTRYLPVAIKEWRDNRLDRKRVGLAARAEKRPTTVRLDANDTLRSLADRWEVDWQDFARVNGITRWPPSQPLAESDRFKVGDTIKVPPAFHGSTSPITLQGGVG